jgi:hypothetical protein
MLLPASLDGGLPREDEMEASMPGQFGSASSSSATSRGFGAGTTTVVAHVGTAGAAVLTTRCISIPARHAQSVIRLGGMPRRRLGGDRRAAAWRRSQAGSRTSAPHVQPIITTL